MQETGNIPGTVQVQVYVRVVCSLCFSGKCVLCVICLVCVVGLVKQHLARYKHFQHWDVII